jgi:uncharacterized protein (TIGR02246 family)
LPISCKKSSSTEKTASHNGEKPVLKPRKETMKIRLLGALAGLAIGFALPTITQDQSAVDPETRQEIEAVSMQFAEAYNEHDASAIAALYTQDAVGVEDWTGGRLPVGRKAIETLFKQKFAGNSSPVVRKLVQMYAFDDRITTISEWSVGPDHGHSVRIYVRDADSWKIRMEFITWAGMR